MTTTTAKVNYEQYIRSPEWTAVKHRRMQIAHNDGHHCYLCDSCRMFVWVGAIDVHHWTYERLGHEEMADLSVLCMGCHASAHGKPLPEWYVERTRLGHIQKWKQEALEFEMKELLKSGQYENRAEDLTRDALLMCAPRVTAEEVLHCFDEATRRRFSNVATHI